MGFNPETMKMVREMSERARATIARRHESPENKMAASIAATETMSSAFACGVANARHGGERGAVTIGPSFPADLAAGVALHGVAALLGHDGEPEPHTAALGTGALAACAYRYGEQLGRKMREASVARQPPLAAPTHVAPSPLPALPSAQPVGETFTVIELPSNPRTRTP